MSDTRSMTDPSCGMGVDPSTAPAFIDYSGRRYYFCSKHCADAFSLDPEQYLRHPVRHNPYRLHSQ